MKISEKKLNFIFEIIRYNFQSGNIVGIFQDYANMNRRPYFVSFEQSGAFVFWVANACEITVYPEDIVKCKVVAAGQKSTLVDHCGWYGPAFEITLLNGMKGRLVINTFTGVQCNTSGVNNLPVVDGWLAPGGTRDAHYNDAFCPEGYTPNISNYLTNISSKEKRLADIIAAFRLRERFPDTFEADGTVAGLYIFDGQKSTLYVRPL